MVMCHSSGWVWLGLQWQQEDHREGSWLWKCWGTCQVGSGLSLRWRRWVSCLSIVILCISVSLFPNCYPPHLSLSVSPVASCDGKGSYESLNGIKATDYLIQAEALCSRVSLFSWVLFRPPWSLEVISSKMCVFHHMRLACQKAEAKQQVCAYHYIVLLSFLGGPFSVIASAWFLWSATLMITTKSWICVSSPTFLYNLSFTYLPLSDKWLRMWVTFSKCECNTIVQNQYMY